MNIADLDLACLASMIELSKVDINDAITSILQVAELVKDDFNNKENNNDDDDDE